jgi:hypothetical protein
MSSSFKQNRVSSVVWTWQQPPAGIGADRAATRRAAVVQVIVMWIVALLLFLFVSRGMASVVVGVSIVVLAAGLWIPPLFYAIRKVALKLGVVVGVLMTWLLLTPFFYLAFFPARIILFLKKRDPLARTFPSPKETMWVSRVDDGIRSRYERQF